MTYEKEITDIQKKYLEPFEALDDDYRKKLNQIYSEHTSTADKLSNGWDTFCSMATSFLESFIVTFATTFVIAFLSISGWVVAGVVILVGTGCVVLALAPEEYVPEWLKGTQEKVVRFVEDPITLVEDIGQGFMDTIQSPEGIASLAGVLVGEFAGSKVGKAVRNKVNVGMDKGAGGTEAFKNGTLKVKDTEALIKTFNGKSAEEIAETLRNQGYDVTVKNSTRSSSGAKIIKVNNPGNGKNVTQVQVSPGGGRHGELPYVKVSTDSGKIKIIDGIENAYKSDGLEKSTNIFTGGKNDR